MIILDLEWLSHPLFLLLIGAVISGILIPFFTNRWQNHEKELEIKTSIVARISESVMAIVTSARFAGEEVSDLVKFNLSERRKDEEYKLKMDKYKRDKESEQIDTKVDQRVRNQLEQERKKLDNDKVEYQKLGEKLENTRKLLDEEYRKFEITSAVIGTQLDTYFPDTGIGIYWTEKFTKEKIGRLYEQAIDEINKCSSDPNEAIIASASGLEREVLEQKAKIIRFILKSSIPILSGNQLFIFNKRASKFTITEG